MEQYKLKHGYHFSGGKQYVVGDIVKTKNNLAKAFPDRFTGIREEVVITTPPVKAEKPIVVAQQADTTDEELEELEDVTLSNLSDTQLEKVKEAVEAPVVAPKKPRGRPKVTRKAPEEE